ncbi:ComEA family DNA-binding protein [Lactobacillus kunkeei]|uniref:helix-hairpin-helix domain-containing protein n=1 Tax=Apilactobacillus kunkeei TaxID=148814 RepID=UPI001362DEF0|nr:ComEA family DNA-binding protein [Apilactobacillus kunkeei]CAI2615880.1 ComE operon protein 1 [Apilactobacillus kunkeei]CAI2616442.1 ComE operon protein 1 [Apilactobacillus kunkeei]
MNKILDFSTQIKEIIDEHAYKILIGLLLIAFSLGLVIILIMNQNSNDANNVATDYSEQSSVVTSSASSQSQSSASGDLYIDVKGEVKHPGVYQIPSNSRVTDVIKEAGGFKADADEQKVNLAKVLNDQDVVVVNKKGAAGSSSFASLNNTSTGNSANNGKVNLNTADLNELQKLNRVGEKKAQKIIDYRNQHNGFHSIDEIKQVSGFGDKTFERLKDSLDV